jgi:hypothetical protein
MITPAHVQANVVDIANRSIALPGALVADANILYWIFYPNFAALAAAGGRGPLHYQLRVYPAYWSRAARAGCRFFTANATVGEFAKVSEHAELEARWLWEPPASRPHPDPARPSASFDPRVCKAARYHYAADMPGIRSDIELTIASFLKSVTLLGLPADASILHAQSSSTWLGSLGDFPDSALVSAALAQGISCFFSDDADLATFPDITLYTSNLRAINAARSAGRLL